MAKNNTLHNKGSQQYSSVFLTEQSPSCQVSLDLQCKQIPATTEQNIHTKLCRNLI